MQKAFTVKETEIPSLKIAEKDLPIQYGGMICYLEFKTCLEAVSMPKEIEVDGVPVRLWHKGCYECSICQTKGHAKELHDTVMKAKENNRKRRAARSNRKRSQNN